MLRSLNINGIPPFRSQKIWFGDRLNLITGDNGVGKTLLLDLCWFALTRTWVDGRDVMVRPTVDEMERGEPPWLSWTVVGRGGSENESGAEYRLGDQSWGFGKWVPSRGRPPLPGVVIYARVDGGFSVWDPLRNRGEDEPGRSARLGPYHFTREDVWRGLRDRSLREERNLCNGLIRDVETWRLKGNGAFAALSDVLRRLSIDEGDRLELGPAIQVRLGDEDQVPTLSTGYGPVPVTEAAAGVKRVLALAYLLVWAADSHQRTARLLGEESEDRMVILFDEVEAHLHPKWQRVFLPALTDVVAKLLRAGGMRNVQMITTTHAPLVAASLDTTFRPLEDRLFNLELRKGPVWGSEAKVETVEWAQFGDATGWLTSPMFDMDSGYSPDAEAAMRAADDLMAGYVDELPEGLRTAEAIHERLDQALGRGDPFWALWLPYHRAQTQSKA